MARLFLPIFVLSALANLAPALSESGETARKELQAAITAEDESRTQAGGGRSGRSGLAYIRTLDAHLNTDNSQQIEYVLNQIIENYRTPVVSQALQKLQAALDADARKREEDQLAEIDAVTKEVANLIPKASKTTDLDAVLEKIEKLTGDGSRQQRSDKVANAAQSLRHLKQFTSSWQDYLHALGSGQRMKANQILRSLTDSNSTLPIPRSLVISLIEEAVPAGETADGATPQVTELDQMAAAIRQLRLMSISARTGSTGMDSVNIDQSLRALAPLEKAYQDFKAGLPVNLDLILRPNAYSGASDDASPSTAALRVKLLLLVIPARLGIPQEAAKPGEDVARFLDRLEKEAAAKGDAATCIRVLETKQLFESSGPGATTARSFVTFFRAGQAQEAAGQPFQAALSYQSALRAGPDITLATLIGKRLQEIKRTHPEDYQKASTQPAKDD